MELSVMLHIHLYLINYLAGLAQNCVQHMLRSASYYFHLEHWSNYSCSFLLQLHAPINLNLTTTNLEPFITPTVASYNFSISSCNCNESALLLNTACIGCSKLILEKYYVCSNFRQCHNSDPQSNFIQHPRINFHKKCMSPFRKFRKIYTQGK